MCKFRNLLYNRTIVLYTYSAPIEPTFVSKNKDNLQMCDVLKVWNRGIWRGYRVCEVLDIMWLIRRFDESIKVRGRTFVHTFLGKDVMEMTEDRR